VEKQIIILAMSEKYHNYCVAGIDINTGEWIRPVSEDESTYGSIPIDISYIDGIKPKILDIAKIHFKSYNPSFNQKENYIYDPSKKWVKIGSKSRIDLSSYVHNDELLFYNNDKKVSQEEINSIVENKRYSLVLIKANTMDLNIQTYEKKTFSLDFNYKSNNYRYIKVTDPIFKETYQNNPNGCYSLNNKFLVLSLGELYQNYYWKMVATVI
jgi:hypothetical protein